MTRGHVSLLCLMTLGIAPSEADPGVSSTPAPEAALSAPLSLEVASTAQPLPFFYDLYTFRGASGGTDVVAAFAVPVELLKREREGGELRYRFDVSLVLADTALRSISRTDDSVFVAVDRPLARGHLLHTYIQVEAPASATTVQRVIMTDASTPGVGQLYTTPFLIPDYGGSQLMLSDIALGLPGSRSGWTRGDVALALLPTSQFPAGSFDVYYEVYNLPGHDRYTTELSIEPLDHGDADAASREDPVRIRFTGDATPGRDNVVRELRHVDVARGAGRHRLTVTVTNLETGESASRARSFEVRGSGPGATLVTALPRGTRTALRP